MGIDFCFCEINVEKRKEKNEFKSFFRNQIRFVLKRSYFHRFHLRSYDLFKPARRNESATQCTCRQSYLPVLSSDSL